MRIRAGIAALGILLCVAAASAQSPSGGDFTLRKSVIAGGSGAASGGPFRVEGTLGQSEPGAMSGADFVVEGGFWVGNDAGQPPAERIFGDGFES